MKLPCSDVVFMPTLRMWLTATDIAESSFHCNMFCHFKQVSEVGMHGGNQDIRKILFDGSCDYVSLFSVVSLHKRTQNFSKLGSFGFG